MTSRDVTCDGFVPIPIPIPSFKKNPPLLMSIWHRGEQYMRRENLQVETLIGWIPFPLIYFPCVFHWCGVTERVMVERFFKCRTVASSGGYIARWNYGRLGFLSFWYTLMKGRRHHEQPPLAPWWWKELDYAYMLSYFLCKNTTSSSQNDVITSYS